MNLGIISRNVGIALICNAIFMLLSAGVSALYGFDSSFSPLLLSAVITLTFGIFPLIFVRKQRDINTREGLAILLLAWLLSCIFGMLPYVLWGGDFTLANAWFESASGITTTGATCLNDIEALPHGLLFWRSSTHYIGGLGVVVFIMMILPSFGSVRFKMGKMEVVDVSKSNYRFKTNEYIKVVVTVYIAITIGCLLCLLLAGMPLFDAVNHAFSAAATGGFSIKNASIAAYDSPLIEAILCVFMILSTLHYGLLYSSFVTRSTKLFKNPIARFYLATLLCAGLAVSADLLVRGNEESVLQALRYGYFEVISTMTTTGFAIVDTNTWSVFAMLVLLYVAMQCGCSGSTTSGIRSDRVWIMMKATRVHLMKMAHPNAVLQVKSGEEVVDRELLSSVSIFILLYLIIMFIGALIYSLFGWAFLDCLSTSISMMSNVGPAFGAFGSMASYADAPAVAKLIMGLQMIIGRLGVFSVFLVFVLFRKRN
jgi:Trk-type K+ transport systems, membrane components